MKLVLPWPPSVNHYWRRSPRGAFICRDGREYRQAVAMAAAKLGSFAAAGSADRLHVRIACYPPDRRRRDIDNLAKCILDSLQHAGVYNDDNQIDRLDLARMEEIRGQVVVFIEPVGKCGINSCDNYDLLHAMHGRVMLLESRVAALEGR